MSITIANVYRTVTLNKITSYFAGSVSQTASYDIPNKATPTVDTDTTTVKPTIYKLSADIGDGEKWTLEQIRSTDRLLNHTFTDGGSLKNVRVDNIEFEMNPGKTALDMNRWKVNIALSGIDH